MRFVLPFASALTMTLACLGAGSAFADCAADLAAMRSDLTASTAPISADGAGTASVGSTAAHAGSAGDTVSSTTAGATPEVQDQKAASSGGETFTQTSDKSVDSAEAKTGQISGIAPTAALDQIAAATPQTGGASAAIAAGEGQATGTADQAEAAKAKGASDQTVMTHLADAQNALDAKDEVSCVKALQSAKAAM